MEIRNLFQNAKDIIEKYDFSIDARKALISYAEEFVSDEALITLAEKYYDIIFEQDEATDDVIDLEEKDEIDTGMFFAIIYLIRLYLFSEVLRAKGIPNKYADAAFWHYNNLLTRNYNCYGYYGFSGMYRKGMIQYIKPSTFRIGRLCYEMSTFSGPYTVYQNKETGATIPLVNAGRRYLLDGKPTPENYDGECFITKINENEKTLTGYTVFDDGHLDFNPITLQKNDHIPVLKKGDAILSVHIPGNEKMTPDIIEESFKASKTFFEIYYKEVEFKAFVCSSWLLDTGLADFLKPNSNILKFQQNFKIVLSFVNTFSLYWHVFGIEKLLPYSELVPKNDFQKNILDRLIDGGHLYSGNGFIML